MQSSLSDKDDLLEDEEILDEQDLEELEDDIKQEEPLYTHRENW